MKTSILIHGSWRSACNWHKVIPVSEAAGHQAIAIDLPGMGRAAAPGMLPLVKINPIRLLQKKSIHIVTTDKFLYPMQNTALTVDAFFEEVPSNRTIALAALRTLSLRELKGYKETMRYAMPCCRHN